MGNEEFEPDEVSSFFEKIGLKTEEDRRKILSQGLMDEIEKQDEFSCIILDRSSKDLNEEVCYAELESDP